MERWVGAGPSPSQVTENGRINDMLTPGDRISSSGPMTQLTAIRLWN